MRSKQQSGQMTLPGLSAKTTKPRDVTLDHWMVGIYRDSFKRTPNPEQRKHMLLECEQRNITPVSWQYAVATWLLNDYSPTNLRGLLDFADEHPGGAGGAVRYRERIIEVEPKPAYQAPAESLLQPADTLLEPYTRQTRLTEDERKRLITQAERYGEEFRE